MEDLTEDETTRVLAQSWFGHLGLAEGGRAYVVPLFYGFDGHTLYFHAHAGLKDEFIRVTEEACFAVSAVRSQDEWVSVMAFGHVEEVHADQERLTAQDALMRVPLPPDWGFTESGEPRRTDLDLRIYRMDPHRVTGRKSTRQVDVREMERVALGGT